MFMPTTSQQHHNNITTELGQALVIEILTMGDLLTQARVPTRELGEDMVTGMPNRHYLLQVQRPGPHGQRLRN